MSSHWTVMFCYDIMTSTNGMNMKSSFCRAVPSSTFHNSDGLHADTTTTVKLVILSPSTALLH